VNRGPFADKSQSPRREIAGDEGEGVDIDNGRIFSVFHVKMRRLVIYEEHFYDNSIKAANLRHDLFPI